MDICNTPVWEENNNPVTIVPWKFTEDLIYLIKNTPQDDYLVLIIIDKLSPNKYDDDEDTKGDNNEDA